MFVINCLAETTTSQQHVKFLLMSNKLLNLYNILIYKIIILVPIIK